MRSSLPRCLIAALSATLALCFAGASAEAAEPTAYELPVATHATSLSVGRDGTAWFVPARGSAWTGPRKTIVGKVSSNGTVSEIGVSGFDQVRMLALDPRDELWVVGARKAKDGRQIASLGRISPTGRLERRYRLPHTHRRQSVISRLTVAGGAVWFIDRRGGRTTIDRLAKSDGAVEKFSPEPGCRPTALARGTNGTMWFAEACERRKSDGEVVGRPGNLGRISHGKVTRRRLKRPGTPLSVAVGPEGTVWFGTTRNGFYGDTIGRLGPTGALAEYPVRFAYPESIAVGAEGRLWFRAASGHSYLTSIGAAGDLSEPVCASPHRDLEPTDIVAAPDGSLWYALKRANLNMGGGGSGIAIDIAIADEAGFIGHLVP